MRTGLVFVGVVFAGAIVVFLVAVTQFTYDPFTWAVQHLDYAAAALVPVIPIAILAFRALPRSVEDQADVAAVAVAPKPRSIRPEKPPATTTTVTAAVPQLRETSAASAPTTYSSVEQLAVASVLERGRPIADVARTLKVRQATVEMWVARARGDSGST